MTRRLANFRESLARRHHPITLTTAKVLLFSDMTKELNVLFSAVYGLSKSFVLHLYCIHISPLFLH